MEIEKARTIDLSLDRITLVRAAEIDTELASLKRQMDALKAERAEIIDALNVPGGYEERTPWAVYQLVPRTKMTPRSIDTDRFLDLYPHLALEYGTLRISVAKAEKGLSYEDFAKVVIPGEKVDIEPELKIIPTVGPVEVTEK